LPTETDNRRAPSAPLFVVDGMLGSLARWLRILGYDADYDPARDDNELTWIARAEGRILLTRDVQLAGRRGIKSLLIQHQELEAQLGQTIKSLGLALDNPFSRCPVCNTPLEEIDKEAAASLVPSFVLETQSNFRRCPACQKVFWQGTHWQRMQAALLKYRRSYVTITETGTKEGQSGP
jgi:uncharacterized protein with PIN domain